MTRQTLPYPTWPVFWGFTLCSVLSGVAFVFPKELSLPFGHSGALETSIIVAIILTPIAILASIFINLVSNLPRNNWHINIYANLYSIWNTFCCFDTKHIYP